MVVDCAYFIIAGTGDALDWLSQKREARAGAEDETRVLATTARQPS